VAAWDTLNKGVNDGDVEHRKKAIAAAGTICSDKQAVELVARGLKDKDLVVRQTAAATLGEMKSPDAIPYLKAALEDSPEVSFTAAKSLWQLGAADGTREFFQEVLEGERKDTPTKMQSAGRMAKKKLRPGSLALMGVKEATGVMFGPASYGITRCAGAHQGREEGFRHSRPRRGCRNFGERLRSLRAHLAGVGAGRR